MNIFNLNEFVGGWFIGNFNPSIVNTDQFEVAIKSYKSGDSEQRHLHRLSEEITVIITGKVLMNSKEYVSGDIIFIEKNEDTDFIVLEDCITCVVKIPSSKNDKYLI